MNIAMRLLLMVGVPVMALIGVGVVSRVELSQVEARGQFIAENQIPGLAVISRLSHNFDEVRVELRNHLLAEDQSGRDEARAAIEKLMADADKLLARYEAGLVSDQVDRALMYEYRSYAEAWLEVAVNIMDLSDQGLREEGFGVLLSRNTRVAERMGKVTSDWVSHAEQVVANTTRDSLQSIADFKVHLFIANLAAILLTALLGLLTFRRVANPIRALEGAVRTIAEGDYIREVPFTKRSDELGGLARSIEVLKLGSVAMDQQRWIKANVARLTSELQGAQTFAEFGQRLTAGLVPVLGGGVAGFYLLEESTAPTLRRIGAYGLEGAADRPYAFALGEGLVGQCALNQTAVTLDHLPPGYLRIASGLGVAPPVQAVALPVSLPDNLVGVLEIASFRAFRPEEDALLAELLPIAAMILDVLRRSLRTTDLLVETQEQALKLAQSREVLVSQQEQIQASEQRTRLILDSSSEGIFGVDTNGRIEFVNAAACRLLSYTAEEMIGQPSHELIHHHRADGSEYPPDECPMVAAHKHGKVSTIDSEFLWCKDGHGLPVEYGATPILKDGAILGAVISFTDITARKQAEWALQAKQLQLRTLVDSIESVIYLKDKEGRHLLVNTSYSEATGIPRDVVLGRTDFDVMPKEVAALIAAQDQRVMESKESLTYEEALPNQQGKMRYYLTTKVPLLDQDDVVYGMCAIATDITERKMVEEDLEKRKEELQRSNFMADSALDLTKAGYWHVPLDGSGWYNSSERAARIFGDIPNAGYRYSLEEWATHVREGDEDAATISAGKFAAALAGEIPVYDDTYAYKRPVDGRVVWIHALGHVISDGKGNPTDIYGVTQDVTEYKTLEMELRATMEKAEEATEMKSMFLANMSHEIRTPMNAIIGLSHLALKTTLTPKQHDYISKVHNAGTSLLGVINDILDFSKIEAGKLEIEDTEFGLDEVISSVTTMTAQKAHEKGLEFLAHVSPDIPEFLLGDPLRLGQILTNFVNNAVKFTETGEIRLNIELIERTGEKVKVKCSVRDTGIGMTPEQSARLFQPFTQADMSITRKHGGTGLGLTICRRLVELMGGQVWLESQAGVGTTFSFTVWLKASTERRASTVLPQQLATLSALVVDDNPAAREILQEPLLAIAGAVEVVSSGAEAIAAIKARDADGKPFDIVFMDWRMPGMDGIMASRHIKSDETLAKPPAIVLVTAFGREEVREEAERVGLEGFLVKPVTKSMLVDTLVSVFAAPGEHAIQIIAQDSGAGRVRGARILLTEDNEINQQIAGELLQTAGAFVTVANNGREAVDILSSGAHPPFDIVLMDLQMPVMDGYQATRAIRSDPRFAGILIIAMTAHATLEERQRCLAAGMDDHISKPIDPSLMFDTLARHFKRIKQEEPVAVRAPAPPPAEVELPVIEGLDTADGLTRVAQNRKLYVKLLRQFVTDQGDAPARIAEAIVAGDYPLAERLAHTVKGVAGSLGARGVQKEAAAMEWALALRTPWADIGPVHAQFTTVLGGMLGRLAAALEQGPHVPPPAPPPAPLAAADPDVLRPVVTELANLLENFDSSAGDCVEANRAMLESLLGLPGFAEFEHEIDRFAYPEALTRLRDAAVLQGVITP